MKIFNFADTVQLLNEQLLIVIEGMQIQRILDVTSWNVRICSGSLKLVKVESPKIELYGEIETRIDKKIIIL